MRIKVMNEKIFCGLDIGSQKVKAGILQLKDNQSLELIGVYETNLHGFKEAAVSDLSELSECVASTMNELMKKAGVKVKEVQLGVNAELVDVREVSTIIPLTDRGSKVISKRDIKKVNDHARLLGVKTEEEVLHDLPQSYRVDDVDSILNPFGLFGRKLGVYSTLLLGNTNRLRNLSRAVNQGGLDVPNIFFSSYSAADIVLNEEDKSKGCVLIDMGSKITSLLIFKDKVLRCFDKIEFGGDHFTQAIAQSLNLSSDLAEEIKKSYGAVMMEEAHNQEEILVKREQGYVPIKRGDIYQAIEPAMAKFIEDLRMVLKNSKLQDQLNAGIVMIGGAALLSGLIERVGKETLGQVRLGKVQIASSKSLTNAAIFASVVGLAYSGYKKTFAYTISPETPRSWMTRVANKAIEMYQEYF